MRRTQLFASFLLLGLAACGGGGGGGSTSGSSSGSTRSAIPPQTALTFSGNTGGATVSATSAGPIASTVVGASGAGRRLARALHGDDIARARNSSGAVAGAVLSRSIPCDSGAININGNVSDTNGTGTVNIDYVDCRTGSDTLNGPGTLRIDSYDQSRQLVTDGLLTFTRVRFTGPGVNFDLSGTIRSQVAVTPNFMGSDAATETLTQNIVTQDNNTGSQTQVNNLAMSNVFSSINSPTFFNESISGQICQTTQGCVTVSTTSAPNTDPWGPLYFATTSQDFPDWGIINLAGATGTVHIKSLGVDLAKIEVDTNNDGIPEYTARLRWSEIGTPLAADLADNDGDGMHNSWESGKGLDPNSAADANIDSDGDGFTNLVEYQHGSDPSTAGSQPAPVRHLWVTNIRDLDVDTSGQIRVFVNSSTSGVLLDPAIAETGAAFSGATAPGRTSSVTDAQGRTFTLSQPAGAPETTWVLTNTNTGATFTVTSVAGTGATSLTRYGAHGIAFRTVGTFSPGYVYLVESTALVP